MHFTLKKNPLKLDDLKKFIECYNPESINARTETYAEENPDGRWRKYSYEDIISRDKTSLDNLPDPDELAQVIMENLESAMASFEEIIEMIKK